MMNKKQRELVDALMRQTLPLDVFRREYFAPEVEPAEQLLEQLVGATEEKSEDDVDLLLFVGFSLELFSPEYVPALARLLPQDWHHSHEDIARLLQELKDPRAIDALYETALTTYEYRDYDEVFSLARKCTWALADIGTPDALSRLKELAACGNPAIEGFARKRIDAWEKEKDRKGINTPPPDRPDGGE